MKNLILLLTAVIILTASAQAQIVIDENKIDQEIKKAYKVGTFAWNMSEESEKEALEKLSPELRAKLQSIKKYDENKYYRLLNETRFKGIIYTVPDFFGKKDDSELKAIREREEKITELEIWTEALGIEYQNATQTEKARIKGELNTKLSALFDLKETEKKDEVRKLEIKLSELRKSLDIRSKNKQEIIERRIQELTEEDDYLEWK